MKNSDSPAMPIGEQIDAMHLNPVCNGLTKREHFAGLAMEGLLRYQTLDLVYCAQRAVFAADELLKALEKS